MEYTKPAIIVLASTLLMSGCSLPGQNKDKYDLPSGAPSYTQDFNEDAGETFLDIGGRNYSYFGTLGKTINNSSVKECIGYVDDDTNMRIYTLTEDPCENYLMVKYTEGIMEQPTFLRAVDTRQTDIYTPPYIDSLGYEYWSSSGMHYELHKASVDLSVADTKVKYVDYEISINGNYAFEGRAGNDSGYRIRRGEKYTIEIPETRTVKMTGTDKPFEVGITFKVTDINGNIHDVDGRFTHDMMLGGYLLKLEIRYDESQGYYLYECF